MVNPKIKMDYRIVVPSRKREDNMENILSMFPEATIVVREEEYKSYLRVTPKEQLVTLPGDFEGGIAKIRAWIMNNFDEDTIIQCDDDLKHVWCVVGQRPRKFKDADKIRRIIENSIQISKDLGISLFYYSRNKKPWSFSAGDPFAFCGGFAGGMFGINGRDLKFDTQLFTREDLDLTLQALKKDRIILSDRRFYFDFGHTFGGDGGNQGLRTDQSEENDKKYMRNKWKGSIKFDHMDSGKAKKKFTTGTRMLVKRKSPLV